MSRDEERLVRETYERVPYPSGAQHHTHPDHVAALAILNGLDPAPPQGARVLELGCADGSNLIPMAAELADSRFVGISSGDEVQRLLRREIHREFCGLYARGV